MSIVGDLVGGLFGTDDAADAQVEAAEKSAELQKQMYDQTRADLMPYMNFGKTMLPNVMEAMQPVNRTQALGEYFNSPEYALLSNQAANQNLAASEAMGGMGATSTSNALASIAPQLGTSYLNMLDQQRANNFNMAMGGANLGQSSAAQVGASGQNYAQGASQAFNAAGQAQAQGALAPMQTLMGLGSLGISAFGAGMF